MDEEEIVRRLTLQRMKGGGSTNLTVFFCIPYQKCILMPQLTEYKTVMENAI